MMGVRKSALKVSNSMPSPHCAAFVPRLYSGRSPYDLFAGTVLPHQRMKYFPSAMSFLTWCESCDTANYTCSMLRGGSFISVFSLVNSDAVLSTFKLRTPIALVRETIEVLSPY